MSRKKATKVAKEGGDWRGEVLSRIRALIKAADPDVVEDARRRDQVERKPSWPPRCGGHPSFNNLLGNFVAQFVDPWMAGTTARP